jgi:hypothetical protein
MKSEFLKIKKNILFWIILILMIGNGISVAMTKQKVSKYDLEKPIIFNGVPNGDYYLVLITSSIFSYYFVLFLALISFVVYQIDAGLFKKAYAYNFKRSLLAILFNKIIFVYVICLISFTCLYFAALYNNLDIINKGIVGNINLFALVFYVKYVANSFFLIGILILLQSLIKNMWLYLLFVIVNLSSLMFINRQYSLFSWYVNALAVRNKFTWNRSFDITHSYQSELFLLITFLIFLFSYLYYEKVNYKKVKP